MPSAGCRRNCSAPPPWYAIITRPDAVPGLLAPLVGNIG